MTLQDRIHSAAKQSTESLVRLVHELSAENYSKDAIYRAFEETVLVVRKQRPGTESREEESLLEVMDLLTGFCDPESALLTGD